MPRNRKFHLKQRSTSSNSSNSKYKQHLQQFNQKLNRYSLSTRDIYADGNCLFRAVSDQLEGTEENHQYYRKIAITEIFNNKEFYQEFLFNKVEDYVRVMSKNGEWGGHLELQALSELLGITIVVHSIDSIIIIGNSTEIQPPQRQNIVTSCLKRFQMRIKNLLYRWQLLRRRYKNNQSRIINIAYHNGDQIVEHYSSIRLVGDNSKEPSQNIPLDIISIIMQDHNQSLIQLDFMSDQLI